MIPTFIHASFYYTRIAEYTDQLTAQLSRDKEYRLEDIPVVIA